MGKTEENSKFKQQFCPKGHDKAIFGVTKKYHCRECDRIRKRKINLSESERENKRQRYIRMMKNPLRRMRKNTVDRLYRMRMKGIS
jgi:hypothetical protein